MEITLSNSEEMPIDNFEKQKQLKDIKIPPPDTKEYKEYFEVKLGGGHPNEGLKKYLKYDRQVLSFKIYWDDASVEGGINFYFLNYFLADDTVEVKEISQANTGKDPFPLLLNRGKLPKEHIMTHYPGMTLKKEEHYSPNDLLVGNSINVRGRNCIIYDCDSFTRDWYQKEYIICNQLKIIQYLRKGVEQGVIEIQQTQEKKYEHIIPPYNGYGTEEDSLGSVFSLQPKQPKKDLAKMFNNDMYILRFEARMISKAKEDNNRKFIISFYCRDDNLQVYECADRNSGIWQGKFLEKTRFINPKTQKSFVDKDMQIGEIIQIGVYKFQLMRADEFTHNYMKERPQIFPEANIQHVINKLKSQFKKEANKYNTFDEFLISLMKTLDKNKNGFIEFNELSIGLKEIGIDLTYQEQYTLFRRFDSNKDWKLSIKELFSGIGGGKS